MSKRLFLFGLVLASFLGAIIALGISSYFEEDIQPYTSIQTRQNNVQFSNLLDDSSFTVPKGMNFVYAANKVTEGVVHIKSSYKEGARGDGSYKHPFEEFYDDFFGEGDENKKRRWPSRSSGSGVIISDDGYIVTNNHVIDDASEIKVTLHDNRTFEGEVVGKDQSTDLALLKIDARDLQFIKYGSSDEIMVGEWVLAVGNPFDLNSTVTAGIVSAKARTIDILRHPQNRQIESFIQTDAAVNPGNSGGALVNLKGELIGINTAIATPTGSYTGYSFAVPVSIVKKVMDDLLEFGEVHRALLGVVIRNVNSNLAEEKDLSMVNGVYIDRVGRASAAFEAGLQQGDIIVAINDQKITNTGQLQELVAIHRPGDEISVSYIRDGVENTVTATLKSTMGEENIMKTTSTFNIEGGTFGEADEALLEKLKIEHGVQLKKLGEGKWKEAGLKEGFIITTIDKKPVTAPKQFQEILANKSGGILLEGIYPDGSKAFYGLGWNTDN